METSDPRLRRGLEDARFATTRWSIVLAAGSKPSPDAEGALDVLCRSYWYPLYAYCRRRGQSADDAADLTQEFFARLLEKEFLRRADRRRGRFRSFLLTIFKRFLSKDRERRQTLKRGGGRRMLCIDVEAGETRYQFEPTDSRTPEALYDRRCALTLLDCVMERLRLEYERLGKGALFEYGKYFLTGTGKSLDDGTAFQLGMSEGALRVALHRLRQRYRVLLLDEVAQTVSGPDEIDDELRHLRSAIRGREP